jgi:hypothetical protein
MNECDSNLVEDMEMDETFEESQVSNFRIIL